MITISRPLFTLSDRQYLPSEQLEGPTVRVTRILTAIVLGLAMIAPISARAQDLEAVTAAEDALIAAWDQTPITFRKAFFATEAKSFGLYAERGNSTFKTGEPLLVYTEPVGYAWRENADGTFTFGFDVDLKLSSANGEVLAEQENFQRVELNSHARNREFMLSLTLDLTGADPGDYVIEYRTRDIASDKMGTISLPFTIE